MRQSAHVLPLTVPNERRDPFNMAVGARIRRRRVLADLQIKHVSIDTGINFNSLSKIERGWQGPTIQTLVKIARALQCTTDELLGLSEERTVPRDD